MNSRKEQEINKSILFYKKLLKWEMSISKDLRDIGNVKRYIANIKKLQSMAA